MKIKKIIKYILKIPVKVIRKLIYILIKLYLKCYPMPKTPTVIISMDGGLCSQMFEYAVGEYFHLKGFNVKFDLQWFKNCGRCVLGKDARFYEINKLYPDLKVKIASKICIEKFKNECLNKESDIEKIIKNKKNIYLTNDFPLSINKDELNKIKIKLFSNPAYPTDKINQTIASEIKSTKKSCAVHVRRGDLAQPEIALKSGYGNIISDSYFENAIKIMNKLVPDTKYYFFSDDLDYVNNNLIPLLKNINYRIVDENSLSVLNGGGYKDFYLITLCNNFICSLGSFCREAAILNKNNDKIIISTIKLGSDLKNQIQLDSNGNLINSTIDLGENNV